MEAFNLKAAIEFNMKNTEAAVRLERAPNPRADTILTFAFTLTLVPCPQPKAAVRPPPPLTSSSDPPTHPSLLPPPPTLTSPPTHPLYRRRLYPTCPPVPMRS